MYRGRPMAKISGPIRLPEVLQGVEFKDGMRQVETADP